ncbi:MAG: N-acetylmuramoyl-L-alanine amidase [Verrucomicrobiota bacterium]|nr:N-acetylmuramoyl-L-alanine amidase [Verrucomicrobiota bacterium]
MKTKLIPLLKYSTLGLSAVLGTNIATASSDYGPAIWNPPCNANYYTSGYGHKFHVCHDMEGYYQATVSMFNGCGYTSASVHYLTNAKTDYSGDAAPGEITQMISESNYAWHVRCWNQHCTGTEHEGFASNPAWYTEAQYQASAGITAHICSKFGYAKDRNHVIAHGQKSVSGWPSWASANLGIDPYCNTHTDPGPYWDWSHYMSLVTAGGSSMAPGPAAVSWGTGRIDVVVRGGGDEIYHKYFDGSNPWLPDGYFEHLAGTSLYGPAICSWGVNRLDTFCIGTDSSLQHKYYDAGTWGPGGAEGSWENLGGSLNSSPAAVSWGSGRIDVVARGGNNNIYHKYYISGSGWLPNGYWENLGGTAVGAPAICSWGSGRLDVFVRGTDNGLYHNYYSSGAWQRNSNWENLGGTLSSAPAAVSWGSGRIDVVVRGGGNNIYHKYYATGSGWLPSGSFENIGGNATSDVGISSWGVNRLDVFCRGTDNSLQHEWYNGSWSAWESLGGTLQ